MFWKINKWRHYRYVGNVMGTTPFLLWFLRFINELQLKRKRSFLLCSLIELQYIFQYQFLKRFPFHDFIWNKSTWLRFLFIITTHADFRILFYLRKKVIKDVNFTFWWRVYIYNIRWICNLTYIIQYPGFSNHLSSRILSK